MSATHEQDSAFTTSGIWISLPFIVVLAYTAFLLTGFGQSLGALQAVPVYVFLCLVLLTLQEIVSKERTLWRFAYVLATSAFAVAYAGEIVFPPHTLNLTRNPVTYIAAEAMLLVAFVLDLARRNLSRNGILAHPPEHTQQSAIKRLGSLATDFVGLAVFFFGCAFLLDMLGTRTVLHALGLRVGQPYVVVNLNTLFHFTLRSPINLLDGLNLALGLAALGVALMLLVMAGALLPSADDSNRPAIERSIWRTLRAAVVQVIGALRLALSPLIWLVPAFALAIFAQQTAQYFNLAATVHSRIIDLFNPFSATGIQYWWEGVSTLLLGLVALAAMILAVMVIEQQVAAVRRTLHVFRLAGRAVALTWAFFMYSLAMVNAVLVLTSVTKVEPFQVGAPGLLALIVGVVMLVYESRHAAQIVRTTNGADTQAQAESQRPAAVTAQPATRPGTRTLAHS